MPDSPNLSSALRDAVTEGREFLARLESMTQTLGSELARHEETIAAERKRLAQLERELDAARQERDQASADRDAAAADRDRARQAVEGAQREASGLQAQLASCAAELTRLRDQLEMVTRDRDALQTDQIQWSLDRERMVTEISQLKEHESDLERDLGGEREQHLALQARHAELTEQANKLASDWVSRRQALTAEIQAQNEEMQQVRKALEEAKSLERHSSAGLLSAAASVSPEHSHLINSRLNLKYLHDSAVALGEAVRSLTGSRTANPDAPAVVDREGRPPDILVADNDMVSRQRIEPFLKRAGYEVVYVDNGPRALEKASHLQPLAMLIDAQLPLSGAPALIKELRKDPRTRDIPLVVLATPDGPPVALPDCEVLTKPIDRQQLVQLMVRFDLMADTKRAKKMPANVLVIDDDLQAISLVKAVLKPFNVRVSAVDSARTGIEQALRNKPDLVILDLVMPGVDGFEVIAALRRDKDIGRIPILVHTAKVLTAEDRQRLEGKVESIVEKAEFQPERFLELLLKRGERRKRAA